MESIGNEICRLNRHRTFGAVSLIAGWEIHARVDVKKSKLPPDFK
jgi:hypothetical protein